MPARMKRHLIGTLIGLSLAFSLPSLAAEKYWDYPVQPGDNLYNLSKVYLQRLEDWQKLQEINHVADPQRLPPYSKLRIPVALLKQIPATAELVFSRGDIQITGPDGQTLAAKNGEKIPSGSRLRTGANATATLRFADGSRLLMLENSTLVLERLVVYGDLRSGLVNTDLNLQSGQVETQVQTSKTRSPHFNVSTPVLSAGVRGTRFRISSGTTPGAASTVEVLEGKVAASSSKRQVALGAGFGTAARGAGALAAPIKLLPPTDLAAVPALIERVPLRLKWAPQQGATGYRVLAYEAGRPENIVLQTRSDKPEAKWADLPDGNYTLRVRAIDSNSVEGEDSEKAFRLKARPEPPFIAAPLDGGKSYGERAELKWSKSEAAASYHVQVAADPAFATPLLNAERLEAVQSAVNLTPGTYYWRIASVRADGDHGPFSDVQRFTQKPIPPSPDLKAPAIDEKRMTFQWPAGEAGATYRFQFARDREFKDMLADKTLSEPRIVMDRPDGGSYFMRAATIDADGYAGPFCPPQAIEVPYPPIPYWLYPLLLAPLL